jgi:hypothetical protein
MAYGFVPINPATFSYTSSGAGAAAFRQGGNATITQGPTSVSGWGIASQAIAMQRRGGVYQGFIDFSKPFAISSRVNRLSTNTDTDSVFRLSYGKFAPVAAGDITSSQRAFMIKIAGGGALDFLVANGTTLTTVTSTFTPVNGESFDVFITSDGSGNAELFVNGLSVATTTGAPSTLGSTSVVTNVWQQEVQNTTTLTNSRGIYCVAQPYLHITP